MARGMTFGQFLRQKRKSRGWTQDELAVRTRKDDGNSYTKSYISAIERDEPNGPRNSVPMIQPETIERLAIAMGESVDEFRLAAGYKPISEHEPPRGILYYNDPDLTDEDRTELEELIEVFVRNRKRRKLTGEN